MSLSCRLWPGFWRDVWLKLAGAIYRGCNSVGLPTGLPWVCVKHGKNHACSACAIWGAPDVSAVRENMHIILFWSGFLHI